MLENPTQLYGKIELHDIQYTIIMSIGIWLSKIGIPQILCILQVGKNTQYQIQDLS